MFDYFGTDFKQVFINKQEKKGQKFYQKHA